MEYTGRGDHGGLAIILSSPSQSAYDKRQFIGIDEHKLLKAVAKAAGFEKVFITYAYPSFYDKDYLPDLNARLSYQHDLTAELAICKPAKILVCGNLAHAIVNGSSKIENIDKVRGRGFTVRIDDYTRVYAITTYNPYEIFQVNSKFRDFASDVDKLATNNTPIHLPVATIRIPDTYEELFDAIELLSYSSNIICDLETNGKNALTDPILSIGLGVVASPDVPLGKQSWGTVVIVTKELLRDSLVFTLLRDYFNRVNVRYIFHNAKFDLKFLRVYFGCDLSHISIGDTMLMNYLLDERPIGGADSKGFSPHGLKTLARVNFDADSYEIEMGKFLATPESQRDYLSLYKYQALDIIYTGYLYYKLDRQLTPEFNNILHKILLPATKTYAEMELAGAPVDREYLQQLDHELALQISDIAQQARTLVQGAFGDTSKWPSQLFDKKEWKKPLDLKLFNPNSPKQVAAVMYDLLTLPDVSHLFRKKPRCTDKNVVAKLSEVIDPGSVADQFLKVLISYRETTKIKSTYVVGLLRASEHDGRVHAEFKIPGSSTGRPACANPNLQNMPSRMGNKIRRAFIALLGYAIINYDFSQLEFRIAAYLSQDPKMMEIYEKDLDLHKIVASIAFGIPVEEVTKEQRQIAKKIGFGVLYGSGAESLELAYGFTHEYAQQLIDNFLNGFPMLRDMMIAVRQQVWKTHQIATKMGRIRRFPFITDKNRNDIGREAINHPIQGLGADFTTYAMINIYPEIVKLGGWLTLTVHDSIQGLVPLDKVQEARAIFEDMMVNHLPISGFNVPMKVEGYISHRWDDELIE